MTHARQSRGDMSQRHPKHRVQQTFVGVVKRTVLGEDRVVEDMPAEKALHGDHQVAFVRRHQATENGEATVNRACQEQRRTGRQHPASAGLAWAIVAKLKSQHFQERRRTRTL